VSDRTEEPGQPPGDAGERSYRSVLVRVLAVQVVSLLLLWLLQATYGR
jgi:hypothetical protein